MIAERAASNAFLSTPSARRATMQGLNLIQGKNISIHALREEGDMTARIDAEQCSRFLSTPSARRATIHHDLKS